MGNPIDVIVGQNIRNARVLVRMTQGELGALVDVSANQISVYEKGDNRISASTLVDISMALKIDLLDLFKGVAVKTSEIEQRSLEDLRREGRTLDAYSALPPDVQKSLCNLMEAMTQSIAHHLRSVP